MLCNSSSCSHQSCFTIFSVPSFVFKPGSESSAFCSIFSVLKISGDTICCTPHTTVYPQLLFYSFHMASFLITLSLLLLSPLPMSSLSLPSILCFLFSLSPPLTGLQCLLLLIQPSEPIYLHVPFHRALHFWPLSLSYHYYAEQ